MLGVRTVSTEKAFFVIENIYVHFMRTRHYSTYSHADQGSFQYVY
jgi:hypothetical protein